MLFDKAITLNIPSYCQPGDAAAARKECSRYPLYACMQPVVKLDDAL